MVWTIIIAVVVIIVIKFLLALNQDKNEFKDENLNEKFSVIVNELNTNIYQGKAKVTILESRSFNLYEDGSNQIVQFFYSTGNLNLTWRKKQLINELVCKENYSNLRNIDEQGQKQIAKSFLNKIKHEIDKHDSLINLFNSELELKNESISIEQPIIKDYESILDISTAKEILIDKAQIEILNELKSKLAENQTNEAKHERTFLLDAINGACETFKGFLNFNKVKLKLTSNDIDEIISTAATNVRNQIFEIEPSSNIREAGLSEIEELEDDKFKIGSLFYQFCFSEETAAIFLKENKNKLEIAIKLNLSITDEEAFLIVLFRSYLDVKAAIELNKITVLRYSYNTYTFKLRVDRDYFNYDSDENSYLEILTNDIEGIRAQNGLAMAIANNFVLYVEDNLPKSIFVVVNDPFVGKYAVRQVFEDGKSTMINFLEDNNLETLSDFFTELLTKK